MPGFPFSAPDGTWRLHASRGHNPFGRTQNAHMPAQSMLPSRHALQQLQDLICSFTHARTHSLKHSLTRLTRSIARSLEGAFHRIHHCHGGHGNYGLRGANWSGITEWRAVFVHTRDALAQGSCHAGHELCCCMQALQSLRAAQCETFVPTAASDMVRACLSHRAAYIAGAAHRFGRADCGAAECAQRNQFHFPCSTQGKLVL